MAIAFHPLLPNETISSNVGRYVYSMGIPITSRILRLVMGSGTTSLSCLLPTDIERLCEEARDYWGKSCDEVIAEHTAFSYMTLLVTDETKAITLGRMISGSKSASHFVPKQHRERGTLRLRYCKECVDECRRARIAAYFKIDHQLPGVLVCPTHETALFYTAHEDADEPICLQRLLDKAAEPTLADNTDLNNLALCDVARRSAAAREGNGENFLNFPYDLMFREAGFESGYGQVKQAALTTAFIEYAGATFCHEAGIHSTSIQSRWWANRNMTRRPDRHLALQSLLAYRASKAEAIAPPGEVDVTARREQECAVPEGVSKWDNSYEVTDRRERRRLVTAQGCEGLFHRSKDSYASVRVATKTGRVVLDCSCGVRVSFHLDEKGSVTEFKRLRAGDRARQEFERLLGTGLTPTAAGRKVGVPPCLARGWRNSMPEWLQENAPTAAVVEDKRRQWKQLTSRTSLTAARKVNQALYSFLHLHDAEWLRAFNRRATASSIRPANVERVSIAVKELKAALPPVWVTFTAVRAKAGLGQLATARALEHGKPTTCLETRREFCGRTLDYWMAHLKDEPFMTEERFLRFARITKRPLTSAQQGAIGEWLAKHWA